MNERNLNNESSKNGSRQRYGNPKIEIFLLPENDVVRTSTVGDIYNDGFHDDWIDSNLG